MRRPDPPHSSAPQKSAGDVTNTTSMFYVVSGFIFRTWASLWTVLVFTCHKTKYLNILNLIKALIFIKTQIKRRRTGHYKLYLGQQTTIQINDWNKFYFHLFNEILFHCVALKVLRNKFHRNELLRVSDYISTGCWKICQGFQLVLKRFFLPSVNKQFCELI